jgi:glycosyltransferase involved in cell wall biosynthesis
LNWLTFARSVRAWGKTQPRFDVIIGSSPTLFAADAGSRLAAQTGARFVFEVRDLWPESLVAAGGRKGVAYAVFARIASKLYRRADRIIVLARGTKDNLVGRHIPAAKISYVPNGVDTLSFDSPKQKIADSGSFTLLYAGAHGPANGLDTVLDAAALLADDPSIKFLLVGDGPAKPELIQAASARDLRNVEFRNLVPKRELPQLLHQVDAGLMVLRDSPLFAYGVSPNKLFDYLAGALPVVCNVPGEVAAMLVEAHAGVQTRDASPAALADAVRTLRLKSPSERAALGDNGREWVAREHSRSHLGRRLDACLRETISA